ncbi:transcriptional regulator swi6 [Phlyctochytrium planicorne]|nr:transcriptional regulator swi6 [Phlyctochytrium planicorne]
MNMNVPKLDDTSINLLSVPSLTNVPQVSSTPSNYSSSSSSTTSLATTPVVRPAVITQNVSQAATNASGPSAPAPPTADPSVVLRVAPPRPPPPAAPKISATPSSAGIGSVYGAIYSGIPVYEMMCRGVAMMRRRSDSYLNATQILKAAGIEKGRRTKILDKEIAHGLHEKIQGGYGKYQGTWIPFDRGVHLARQFDLYNLIQPLLELDAPPLGKADKTPTKEQHMAALRKASGIDAGPSNPKTYKTKPAAAAAAAAAAQIQAQASAGPSSANPPVAEEPVATHGMTRRPKRPLSDRVGRTSRSDTPSSPSSVSDDDDDSDYAREKQAAPSRKKARQDDATAPNILRIPIQGTLSKKLDRHRLFMMNIFVDADLYADVNTVPEFLTGNNTLEPDLDIDLIIDDQGHTSLHWAAALARMGILNALIQRGADPKAVNYGGETALIRAVLVPSCFEVDCFKTLLQRLGKDVIPMADLKGRTVLHHLALMSTIKQKAASVKYYLDGIVSFLNAESQKANGDKMVIDGAAPSRPAEDKLKRLLNAKDINGDTALNVAARLGSKALVERLLQVGADRSIPNNAGLVPADFGLDEFGPNEDEEILATLLGKPRAKPLPALPNTAASSESSARRLAAVPQVPDDAMAIEDHVGLERRTKEISQGTIFLNRKEETNISKVVHKMVSDLGVSFTDSLREKHEHLVEAQLQLKGLAQELAEVRKENQTLRAEAKGMPEMVTRLRYLYRRFSATTTSPLTSLLKKWVPEGDDDEGFDISELSGVIGSGDKAKMLSKKKEIEEMLSFVKSWQILYEQDMIKLNSCLSSIDPTVPKDAMDTSADEVAAIVTKMPKEELVKLAQRELKCRKILSASCNLPLEMVGKVLDPLLEALENESKVSNIGSRGVDVSNMKTNINSAIMPGH